MDWYATVFELIDMRSFSNLWYWIGLAVLWSTTSHWVMGIPFDLIQKARRKGGDAMEDVQDLARINVNRILYISRISGLWLLGFSSFVLTGLAILGFYYHVEFAQAVLLLAGPMALVGLVAISTARVIHAQAPHGEDLCKLLMRHRVYTQFIGMAAIFVTAMWGMYQTMSASVLGG